MSQVEIFSIGIAGESCKLSIDPSLEFLVGCMETKNMRLIENTTSSTWSKLKYRCLFEFNANEYIYKINMYNNINQ